MRRDAVEHPGNLLGIGGVAAQDAVAAEAPEVAVLGHRVDRRFRRRVGIGEPGALVGEEPCQLELAEADQIKLEAELAKRKVREGTKQGQLIEMLKRPEGATIDEIVAAFGWQPHTVRGAIAGALKKKLGLAVTSEKVDDRARAYRIET
jgi:hypothetical protein